jgi:hypothetical protein
MKVNPPELEAGYSNLEMRKALLALPLCAFMV